MSIAPIAPVGPTAAALRVQVISAVETELMAAADTVQQAQMLAPDAKPATPPPPLPNPVRQAVDVARASAATRQTSLAPLFADLAQAQAAPALPAAVKAAISQLLALRMPFSGLITAETVKQAIAQSGLFLEAHLTEAESPAAPDLKSALLTLQRALTAAPAAEPAPRAHPVITAPPVRDAVLTGQAPARPTLSTGDDVGVVIQHLARGVDGAVARQVLHQLASLPDGSTTAWMFELPIATPQGTALAQFEIDRHGAGSGAEAADAAWRVRFSIDIEPLGPVHVHLGVKGDRAAVTVWAEREEGLERLRAQGAELSRALPADVVFHPGAPRRPSPAAGQFVDRTS
jgi:hypothetical protein